MTFKAICSDIDGTLLNADRVISDRLKNVLTAVPLEVPLVLASARMPAAMYHLLQDLHRTKEPIIAYNGALVFDAAGNELESICIPISLVQEIVHTALPLDLHLSLFHGDNWYTPEADHWASREIQNTKVRPTWKSPLEVLEDWASVNLGAHKVMCMGDPTKITLLYQVLLQKLGTQLHLYRSKDTYLEIAPKPISKATGLKKILDHGYEVVMGEVVAFGDGYNDIDLLQQVGWGVAVENAFPEVKAVANEITLHHKEDGVATTLERIFLGKK